jgi:hypothetical protein
MTDCELDIWGGADRGDRRHQGHLAAANGGVISTLREGRHFYLAPTNTLQSEFPTRRNRELIVLWQGIKSAYQGSFAPDQGRLSNSDRPFNFENQKLGIAIGALGARQV